MELQNLVETLKVLNLLKINFSYIERDKTPEQLSEMWDIYAELLDDLDPILLKRAALQVMTETRFFPSIAELREKAISIREAANETPDYTQAWNELIREVKRVGYMSWPETQFTTPLIREVAKTFWRDACLSPEDNLSTVRAQFRDTYNARIKRTAEEARMLPGTRAMIKELASKLDMGKRLLAGGDRNAN